jgi:hypothetical protein
MDGFLLESVQATSIFYPMMKSQAWRTSFNPPTQFLLDIVPPP